MLNTANQRYAADSWNYLDPDQQQLRLPNSPLLRSALAGGAGFVVYGGWAVYANIEHGTTIGIRSGLVQGTYSLVLTFIMTLVTEWLFTMLAGLRRDGKADTSAIAGFADMHEISGLADYLAHDEAAAKGDAA